MNQPTRCRVLLVDDHEDMRVMLSALLGLAGYDVEAAGTVEEGLRLARGGEFDLYVLDKRFPDGDGAELCRRLKELDAHAPVVIYSGLVHERDRREGVCAGAEAYVTKPNNDGLLSVVNDLLKSKRLAGDAPRDAN